MCRTGYDVIMNTPNFQEFMNRFKTENDVYEFIVEHICPNGEIVCPYCGNSKYVYKHNRPKIYMCGNCRRDFSIFVGTMFESTQTSLINWFHIIYEVFVSRKSISNFQLRRETHMSNTSIYTKRRLIQAAMNNYDLEPFSGVIQIDEVFTGGSNHGRFSKKDFDKSDKVAVLGIYDGAKKRVYSYPSIPDEKGRYLSFDAINSFVEKLILPGSTIVSDDFRTYRRYDKPDSKYKHEAVDHSINQRVNENGYTTNGIEGYWGIVKKMYYSTHSNLPKEWLYGYLIESDFRYNHTDFEKAIDDILYQGVFSPQVIDIRRMGRFGNKTYDLKDYRMILPEQFDDVDIKDITLEDIMCSDKPVYGILRKNYQAKPNFCKRQDDILEERKAIGIKPYGNGYKDYRDRIENTVEDVMDMLKDATKSKDVNICVPRQYPKKPRSPEAKARRRKQLLKERYDSLPPFVQVQIKQEYPNLFLISSIEKTSEIRRRMTKLLNWYNKNIEITEEGFLVTT